MRYDAEHKARTRGKVLRAASEAIRAEGPAGVGVADIMGRAGLTHGGFYAHFKSKDALVTAAIDESFADNRSAMARAVAAAETPQQALATYIRFYLSRSHRDGRESGCPVAALAADMSRLDAVARAHFGEGVKALTDGLTGLIADCGQKHAAQRAISTLAEMQGALALARAVADPEQSEAILTTSRHALLRRLEVDDEAPARAQARAERKANLVR